MEAFLQLLKLLSLILNFSLTSAQTWPSCIDNGFDFTGDDVISGLRFSNEECALWCNKIGLRCVRWVYSEIGTTCHVKAIEGSIRNASNPLTKEDLLEFPDPVETTTAPAAADDTTTPIPATTVAPSGRRKRAATTIPPSNKELRIAQRIEELKLTFTGAPDCIPPPEVFWDTCVVRGKTIDGADIDNGTDIPDLEMDACSFLCLQTADCKFWQWKDTLCSLKSDMGAESSSPTSFYGQRSCSGRVEESPEPNEQPLDGNWSPWSTLATPCFSKRTGKLVECGGGIMYRYRSCSFPTPRAGGKVCVGENVDEHPCNFNSCPLPDEFLWSEWGVPDVACGKGHQKRTTMCGSLRRRLPNPGRDPDAPPVYWPSCLNNVVNEATPLDAFTDKTLEQCMTDCKVAPDADCQFWTFNKTAKSCTFNGILKAEKGLSSPVVLTGEKMCTGKLFYPHCAEMNVNYTGAPLISPAYAVSSLENCTQDCDELNECKNWLIETSEDFSGVLTCELRGDVPSGETPEVLVNGTFLWGSSSCVKSTRNIAAIPEDAEELSYKETCKADQYKEMTRENNTWNREFCPSPCLGNGDCPRGAQCIDLSDDIGPNHTCICRMGMVMEANRCIVPPPSTAASSEIETMAPDDRATALAVSKSASFVLIGFVTATLIIFAIGRIFNHGRFIHMNIEISLLLAHICLIPDLVGDEVMCRFISICIHFFFTVAFAFFTLEAVFMYSILGNVVRKNGMLSNGANFSLGWGCGIVVIAFSCSFEYERYAGDYHCWLNYDSTLMFAQLIPITVMIVATIMMIEAAGSVDENTMTRLDGSDEIQRTSAKYMHRSLILRCGLCFVSFLIGSLAFYQQNFGLYFIFTVLNGILGFTIFFFHCTSNETVRAKLSQCFGKMCGKKTSETETQPIINDD